MSSNPISNRYEFLFYLECRDANPNGDPDMGNMPRFDPDTMQGYITDVALKRRVRDYVEMAHGSEPGMNILVQSSVNLNRKIAEAKELAGVKLGEKGRAAIDKARAKACEMFFDVRAFGAVLSTGPNAGQVRGPVQLTFGRSLDPIRPTDVAITSVAARNDVNGAKTAADYARAEDDTPLDKLRTIGRKQFVPFGLYVVRGFVSANMAEQTGFDDQDLDYLFEALTNMFEVTRTASKGLMSVVSPLIIFKHVGDPACGAYECANQARLGRAPAHKLFDLVRCERRAGVDLPTDFRDYDCFVDASALPAGVEVGFRAAYSDGVVWGRLPAGETWVRLT